MYRCVGDSALLAGSYQTKWVYVDTLQSYGCDSIVSTTLIVDTVVYSTTDLELCYGDNFWGVCMIQVGYEIRYNQHLVVIVYQH